MARFVVDLGDVKLSDEEHNGIASAIHTAVIGQLAKVADPSAHAATKTLNHAGMGFAAPSPATKAAGTKAASTKATAGKAVTAKPAAAAKAARKGG